ncbi:MAG: glutamate racemase [Firmicutes bacterium]|nr:glutamate racemase [Bacillota bacterium]
MDEARKKLPIGVFDSGVGGISVLAEMVKHLPREEYIYFADSLNNPYGTKEVEEARRLSLQAADFLVSLGIKALVVACNTATSVAINQIRERLAIPVIGMEPAVKPAVEQGRQGTILVMATPNTLKLDKFNNLLHRFDEGQNIIPLPCPGLADLIEKGNLQGKIIENYLSQLFSTIDRRQVCSIVLGCTHYLFIKPEIARLFGKQVSIIDGNLGTVKQLRRVLQQENILVDSSEEKATDYRQTKIRFYASGNESEVIALCQQLLDFAWTNYTNYTKPVGKD